MSVNYELIAAKDLPTTDAKEVDVLCVEDGELKRKAGASIGGAISGGYVIKLPAETDFNMSEEGVSALISENYDNFADVLYNGGTVWVDFSAIEDLTNGAFARVAINAWMIQDGMLMLSAVTAIDGIVPVIFVCMNGTWTPPSEQE